MIGSQLSRNRPYARTSWGYFGPGFIWIEPLAVALSPHVFFDLTDMPADFGNAESASIEVRAKTDGATAAIKLYVQLFQSDETTALSNEVEAVSLDTDAAFANFTATITGIDTAAAKSVWDNAMIRFRWSSV